MKILKVIVDELPTGCDRCDLVCEEYHRCCVDGFESKRDIVVDWDDFIVKEIDYRPDWCPLVRKDLYDMEIIQNFVGKESEE